MNNLERPLSIIFYPRTGSSMLTGIFVHHGYWFHQPAVKEVFDNMYKTDSSKLIKGAYENAPIKRIVRKYPINKSGWREYKKQMKDELTAKVLESGYQPQQRWVSKVSYRDYYAWRECFPAATYVFCRRNVASIVESNKAIKFKRHKDELRTYLLLEGALCDQMLYVNYERIIDGDYSQIDAVARQENLTLDYDIINRFVDPERKHF